MSTDGIPAPYGRSHSTALPADPGITSPARLAILVVAVGCAALVAANLAGIHWAAAIAKQTASTGFLALALASGARSSRYGRLVLAGLGFSWFGDAFLLGTGSTAFLLGLGAFLLAHVVYVGAFAAHGFAWRPAGAAFAPVAAASAVFLWWIGPYVPADMRLAVGAYVVVISTMVALAVGTRGAGGTLLIPAGAVLFYLSDVSVAAGQFVKPDFPNYVWGLPFYYAGQVLLALSVAARARPRP